MASYRPLFTVGVEHAYFADGTMREVDFVPCSATARMVASTGVVVKPLRSGIGVLYEAERLAALRMHVDDGKERVRFVFKCYAKDKSFGSYTKPPVPKDGRILCFGNAGTDGDLLTRQAEASEADYAEVDALVAHGILGERERRILPDFVVMVEVKVGEADVDTSPAFRVRFGARQSFWKYNLLGKMNRSDVRIVDLDNKVEFAPCGEVTLPEDRKAQVFRSTTRIPLSERSTCRFQLRERDRHGDRVLVKRLPVAAESRLGAEVIDGKTEIVFENYVNF